MSQIHNRISRLLLAAYPFASPRTLAARVFITLLLSALTYRVSLLALSLRAERPPILFDSPWEATMLVGSQLIYDLLTALVAGALAFALHRSFAKSLRTKSPAWLLFVELLITVAVAIGFGFAAGTQMRLLMSMHSGFSFDVLAEGFAAISINDLFGYAKPIDIVLLVIPPTLAIALFLLPRRNDRVLAHLSSVLTLTICLSASGPFVAGALGRPAQKAFTPAAWNPIAYFLTSTGEHLWHTFGKYEIRARRAASLNQDSAYLDGSRFTDSGEGGFPPSPTLVQQKDGWNVVLFILESAGASYAFDDAGGTAPMPMPFLRRLAGEGLHLSGHFSTSNTSPRAIFSILTGLYPMPRLSIYSTGADLRLPSLATFIGKNHQTLLVTPSRLESYFPRGLLANVDFRNMFDYYTIPGSRPSSQGGRNELDAADHFLSKLGTLETPFLAIYYSFVPHYPYDDPGPAYRVRENTALMLDRYYNNLRLLDAQIERTYAQLEARGQLDRTIFVFVGDHGETFGQHTGNLGHSRHVYNENIQVPAVFFQPRLFKPKTITSPTSHVDLLPTLLDAMSIPFDPRQVQGESLLRAGMRRRHIFAVGNENSLVAINRAGLKTIVNFSKNRCEAYDLSTDPTEQAPLDCHPYNDQLEASFVFRKFQREFLPSYNDRQ